MNNRKIGEKITEGRYSSRSPAFVYATTGKRESIYVRRRDGGEIDDEIQAFVSRSKSKMDCFARESDTERFFPY